MRGGRGGHRLGNLAEAFVIDFLGQTYPTALFLPLEQGAPADLVGLFEGGGWCLYEVKSSKTRRQAVSARLSLAEEYLFKRFAPLNYQVIRVWRHPGHPTTFEVLSRGA